MAHLPKVGGLIEQAHSSVVVAPQSRQPQLSLVSSQEPAKGLTSEASLRRGSEMIYLQLVDHGSVSREIMINPHANKPSCRRTVTRREERERAAYNAHVYALIARARARKGQLKSRKAQG